METLDPLGGTSLDPRVLIGRIYVGGTRHCSIVNIQVVGLKVSEKQMFKMFFSL